MKTYLSDGKEEHGANRCIQLIKAGEGIIASNQSANRDEEVFTNPDAFDLHREWPAQVPLGYGFGDHRCIAEGLAKAELITVFCKPSPTTTHFREDMQLISNMQPPYSKCYQI